MKTVITFLLCALSLAAQARYSATTGDVSLAASGTSLTIQQPASGAKLVRLESAVVYCSVACNITQSANGTAATATAGTAVSIPPYVAPASATVWTASNVGAGSAIGGIVHVTTAPNTVVLDLSQVVMGSSGTGNNYTVAISSITGTANITFFWSER